MGTSLAAPRFPLLDYMPPSLREGMEGSAWDFERLWTLEAPVEAVPVDQLRWHLGLPLWRHEEAMFAVTPNQVRGAPELYGEQHERTLTADLSFALAAVRTRRGLVILDGMHRLLKADLLGERLVRVRCLAPSRLAAVCGCYPS